MVGSFTLEGEMKHHSIGLVAATVLALSGSKAAAEDTSSVPIQSAEPRGFEAQIGLSAGGPFGLLFPVKDVEEHSTQIVTQVATIRIRLPKISPRALELYGAYPNGFGANLKNDDFHIGNVRLHLFDLGLFYSVREPISVQRVDRKLDITVGFGAEWEFRKRWSLTLDWRSFIPANIPKVLADYGDFSRLVLYEALQGGQTWLGISYRFW